MGDKWENSFVEAHYKDDIVVKENQREDPKYEEKLNGISECMKIVGSDKSGTPLNIAVIGPPGCGKSSFINTVLASFNTDRWKEIARVGNFGDVGGQFTARLASFSKADYYRSKDNDSSLLPVFLDMTGFEDFGPREKYIALLDLVFTGRIRSGEKLIDILNAAEQSPKRPETFLKEYNLRYKFHPVDRIIVVCSSNPESNLYENLLITIMKAARKNREIPVYGVLTHADKYKPKLDKNVSQRIKRFRELLGLPQHRFAHIINYCEAIDPDRYYQQTTVPTLDVPILQLMQQVLNPDQSDPKKKTITRKDILAILAFIMAVFAYLYVLFFSKL